MAAADEAHADEAPPVRVTWFEVPTYGQYYRSNGEGFAVHSRTGRLLACMRCLQKMRVYRRRVPAYLPNENGVFEFEGWLQQPNVVLKLDSDHWLSYSPAICIPRFEYYWLQHIECSSLAELAISHQYEESEESGESESD